MAPRVVMPLSENVTCRESLARSEPAMSTWLNSGCNRDRRTFVAPDVGTIVDDGT